MNPIIPVLAIDPGAIVGLIVLVLSVLGWLVNLIKGEDNAPKARPRPGNATGKDLRSEIQDFLDELSGGRKPARPNRPAREEEVIILEEDEPVQKPVRPAKQQKQRKKEKVAATPTAAAPSSRPLSQVQQQHLQTSNLGSGVQQHLAAHMAAGQVTAQAESFIGHRVEQAVEKDIGTASLAAGAVPGLSKPKLHPALAFLARPGSIRDAIVLNEILQPPKSLRSRSN